MMDVSSDKYLESINSKYGNLDGDLIVIDLSRNQLNQQSTVGARNSNLGLSLAGNKDRSVYSVFVCGIHPEGLCARDGRIQVGDQLIEANGVQLLGRCHLNAGAILQQLPGLHIKLVILRKTNAIKEMAVKPLNQFPTDELLSKNIRTGLLNQSLSNEIMEKFKSMVKIVTLKKESKGLGIMITEGLHPEIGKGIFIKEIYSDSVAENSELQVSDMLISVNQIQLINMDYDLALNLLKNMDGLITIIAIKTNVQITDLQTPSTTTTKLIKRIKLMNRKARQSKLNRTRCSSTLSDSNSVYNNPAIFADLIDQDKEVKLVKFSNLNLTFETNKAIIPTESIVQSKNEMNYDETMVETVENNEMNRSNSVKLECINGEEQIKTVKEIKFENSDEISDRILHELHVNSQINQKTSPSNQTDLCTSAKEHLKDNQIVDSTSPSHNESSMIQTTLSTEDKDDLIIKKELITNELITNELITNELIKTVDEIDSIKPIETNNEIPNTEHKLEIKINQSIATNQPTKPKITNDDNQQTHKTESLTKPTVKIQEVTKPSPQLTTNQPMLHEQLDEKRKTNKKLIQETDLRTTTILNGVETWVELNKGSNCALGIDLIERTINEEKLFFIHEIIEKGIAETDQRLNVGDVILQVNDIPLKDMSCEEAIEHLNRTSGSVKLLIYRELICVNESAANYQHHNESNNSIKVNYSTKSTMQESERDENVEQRVINGKLYEIIQVELQKKSNNKGLGLCIVNDNGKSPGPYISEILPNSVAYSEGSLKKGDHIVNVNGEDVTDVPINTTIAMLKCLQGLITLKVARLLPGNVVSLESFNRNQVEPKQINFKFVILNPFIKLKNLIKNTAPINDRVKELTSTSDTESVTEYSLIDQTVCTTNDQNNKLPEQPDTEEKNKTEIGQNWIKIEKSNSKLDKELLNSQLANLDISSIDQLEKENKIVEINGQNFDSSNGDKILDKLKRSTDSFQMLVVTN